MEKILVIGIAGGTGSGKTTLMKNLIARFGDVVTVLSHDNYYRRHDELTYEERCQLNYDEPAAMETELMVQHLDALRHGQEIDCPVYDFTVHKCGGCPGRRAPGTAECSQSGSAGVGTDYCRNHHFLLKYVPAAVPDGGAYFHAGSHDCYGTCGSGQSL